MFGVAVTDNKRCADGGATAEYPATIVPDSTCAHIFKERDMCRNKLTQVAGYSAVKLLFFLTCDHNWF